MRYSIENFPEENLGRMVRKFWIVVFVGAICPVAF